MYSSGHVLEQLSWNAQVMGKHTVLTSLAREILILIDQRMS